MSPGMNTISSLYNNYLISKCKQRRRVQSKDCHGKWKRQCNLKIMIFCRWFVGRNCIGTFYWSSLSLRTIIYQYEQYKLESEKHDLENSHRLLQATSRQMICLSVIIPNWVLLFSYDVSLTRDRNHISKHKPNKSEIDFLRHIFIFQPWLESGNGQWQF